MDEQKQTSTLAEARKDVQRRMFTYIGTALGLVIGLAWNDAISSLIKSLFPDGADSILAKFVYAVVLTIIIGVALFLIDRVISKDKK